MNSYRSAMDKVKFNARFGYRVINVLQDTEKKRLGYRKFRRLANAGIGIATCVAIAVAVLIALQPQDTASVADEKTSTVTATATCTVQEAATPTAADQLREVVKPSDYGEDTACYMAPEPGQTIIAYPIKNAMDGERNQRAMYFVGIDILTPEQYAARSDDYLYNGRTISEWNELISLSKGEYPYNEYNGDHGGDVTVDQWEQAQEEAKKADAQKNRDAAMAAYKENVAPMLAQTKGKWEAAEIERLSQLGYDVFMYDSWTYVGQGDKQAKQVFAGLLTKDQLLHFGADEDCGYFIDWVHNGDGVVEWEMRSQ